MRRLVQHALAAAGISVLTAGAVVGSLSSAPVQAGSMAVSAPIVSSSVVATPVNSSASTPAATDALDRVVRGSRGNERVALGTSAASTRSKALLAQSKATATEQAELAKKLAKKKAAEAKKRAAAAKKKAEQEKERKAAAARAKKQGYDPGSSPKSIAKQIMKNKYGWGAKQFSCYNNIIMRESMWDIHADNPTSSAYGIPQALPGSKMASAGPDWRTNPATQIKWGLGYVKSRYGTPCSAWGFKSSHGWY